MSEFDLFDAVQPAGGWTAIVGIRNKIPHQRMLNTRLAIDKEVARLLAAGYDVYFGVAKFKEKAPANKGKPRGKLNVLALRSFWMDLDCGPGKGYETQSDAVAALGKFLQATKLPMPIVVSSGYGLHLYWPLSEDVAREDWEPVAEALRDKAKELGLYPDPTCFEVARILRVPGTLNFKGHTAEPVEFFLTDCKPISLHAFMLLVGTTQAPAAGKPSNRPKGNASIFPPGTLKRTASRSALTQALATGAKTESFRYIMSRRPDNGPCAQLLACYQERVTLSEPRWRAALSIAQKCTDRNWAIHKLSDGHPDYDPADTEYKANQTQGPQSCNQFELHNPGGCTGCKWQGLITSPIELGHERPDDVLEAVDEDEDVAPPEDAWDLVKFINEPLPSGYRWELDGSIRAPNQNKKKESDKDELIVSAYPIVLKKHLRGPQGEHSMLFCMLKPRDGYIEFIIPASKTSSARDLDAALLEHGAFSDDVQPIHLRRYVQRANLRLTKTQKVSEMRVQFGWADNGNKFVLGRYEFSKKGRFHADLSEALGRYADMMVPTGSFAKWKAVMDLYGAPGMEANAFAAGTGFGAPLLKFSGQEGALISLVHPDSGTGKTTALRLANSIWGDPQKLLSVKGDTPASRMTKLGYHCNLPYCIDEMTAIDPEELSALAYAVTQGVGKDRMQASSNDLRANTARWQTIALCSSNASFYEKLESLKAAPEGERMRILEYEIAPSALYETKFAGQMFDDQLNVNFGHIGPLYAQWLVTNTELAKRMFIETRDRIHRVLKLKPNERFWSSTVAANLTGISIAIGEGWVDWNYKAIQNWAYDLIRMLRGTVKAPADGVTAYLGDFINLNSANHLLVVDYGVDQRKLRGAKGQPAQGSTMGVMHAAPTTLPRHELRMRYEPDQKRLFITCSAFQEYCTRRNIGYTHTLKEMVEAGLCEDGNIYKHMTRGVPGASSVGAKVRVIVCNDKATALVDLDALPASDGKKVANGS